jgi:hypothetical protein
MVIGTAMSFRALGGERPLGGFQPRVAECLPLLLPDERRVEGEPVVLELAQHLEPEQLVQAHLLVVLRRLVLRAARAELERGLARRFCSQAGELLLQELRIREPGLHGCLVLRRERPEGRHCKHGSHCERGRADHEAGTHRRIIVPVFGIEAASMIGAWR